ncbi:hypothetical protein NLX67_19700 [Domibacillus sp. A3M-37]|uniref:hypothetical protein n=1 Tax=Domibacillus sp. A3M-37 TaxID=2962037 RepID=UPI0020B7B404|nr:hypothetical protein [Domibacillus sp. A3M-37]MCP3764569.1 hypothetical protein [Domibacillus sp. A3M-37]
MIDPRNGKYLGRTEAPITEEILIKEDSKQKIITGFLSMNRININQKRQQPNITVAFF